MGAGAGDRRSGSGPAVGRTLLDRRISYAEVIDWGALEFVTEDQLRRWFAGRETVTVAEVLDVPTHIAWKFWVIMRDEVLPDSVLHQFAVDYATEFLRRAEPAYTDFRTRRGLAAKQDWLTGRISIGELRVAAISADQARTTVADFGDERVSDCSSIVCQSLAESAEDAQRHAFYAFLGSFGTNGGLRWLLDHVRTVLGQTPSDWEPSNSEAEAPAWPVPAPAAAGQAMVVDADLPVGTVLGYAGELPKDLVSQGWIVCDGTTREGGEGKPYFELFLAIGYAFGQKSESSREFYLPDLRGRFIRSTAPDVEKRQRRDPEWKERFPLMPRGEAGPNVGSYQTYGTASPRKAFSTRIDDLDIVNGSDAAGCGANPAKYHSNSASYKLRGGDAETRPANKYVYFIIKASTLDASGKPVRPPVGAVIPFAGPAAPPSPSFADHWVRCTGQDEPQDGRYSQLFRAIGIAHGGGSGRFRFPDYRGWFLRGVSELSSTDPDRDTRAMANPGGLTGNNVGSQQDWATALPYERDGQQESARLLRTSFQSLPTENRGKYVDTLGHWLAQVNHGSKDLTLLLGTSGDAETRPENVSVDFYVKFHPDGTFPVGAIAAIGADLPDNDYWLPCDGRSLPAAGYQSLHQVIGNTYGSSAGQFKLPDLEARFLRGASESAGVGTVQEYATGRPRKDFAITVPHLPVNRIRTHGGARGDVARINGAKDINPWSSGGNADTRPVNLYLNFYIRVR